MPQHLYFTPSLIIATLPLPLSEERRRLIWTQPDKCGKPRMEIYLRKATAMQDVHPVYTGFKFRISIRIETDWLARQNQFPPTSSGCQIREVQLKSSFLQCSSYTHNSHTHPCLVTFSARRRPLYHHLVMMLRPDCGTHCDLFFVKFNHCWEAM